jgi:hypothetical protein
MALFTPAREPIDRAPGPGGTDPPGPDVDPRLARLTHWLDEAFTVPGTSLRVGLDGLIGLMPGVGDVVTLAVGYFMWREATRLGVPRHVKARMAGNYLLDLVGGLVPVVGDLFDFGFKANSRNLRLLRAHLARRAARR